MTLAVSTPELRSATHLRPSEPLASTSTEPVARGHEYVELVSPAPSEVEKDPDASETGEAFDAETIQAAVAPNVSMLRQVALRILRCSEQADDAVQDAMIALWNRGERPAELRGWLVRTVIHRSLHRRRTEMRRQRWEEAASLDLEITCPFCDPEEEFAQRELLAVTEAAIAGLGSDHQLVIELRAKGLEYDEIAQRLGLPIGTVRSRLNRARRSLRDQLFVQSV